MLFEELAELCGQRNALDGRIVEIVAEMDRDQLWGMTGARSVPALVAWKTGCSPANAQTIATIAGRLTEFPRCAQALSEGRLSLDQVGVIAARAGEGSDEHYVQLAQVATVNQLRTAVKLEPRAQRDAEPDPELEPKPQCSFIASPTESGCHYRITLGPLEAAKFDAAVASHRDALFNHWKLDNETSNTADVSAQRPPMPSTVDAFMRLVEAGWDAETSPPPARAAQHRGRAPRRRAESRRPASGPATVRRRTPVRDL